MNNSTSPPAAAKYGCGAETASLRPERPSDWPHPRGWVFFIALPGLLSQLLRQERREPEPASELLQARQFPPLGYQEAEGPSSKPGREDSPTAACKSTGASLLCRGICRAASSSSPRQMACGFSDGDRAKQAGTGRGMWPFFMSQASREPGSL